MGQKYEELMAVLSPERRARVEARTAELVAEGACPHDLHEAERERWDGGDAQRER